MRMATTTFKGQNSSVLMRFRVRMGRLRAVVKLSVSQLCVSPLLVRVRLWLLRVKTLIGDSLRFFKHDVTLAPDGETGLQLFNAAMNSRHPFDAVITDLGMPNMNGREVAKAIKARHPSMPVIILTGWNNATAPHGERNDPAVNAVLGKPPSLQELNNTLLRVTTGTGINRWCTPAVNGT